jgi:ATP-dependent Clp protease ATP-binding subunit ClpC
LLLGLLREMEGIAARVLESLVVSIEEVRTQVVRIVGQGDEVASGQIPFTPRAKSVLELALRECLGLGHNYIGTEHLLLGLVHEGEGVATKVLLGFGVDAERVHDEVMAMLGGTRGGHAHALPQTRGRRRHWSPLPLVVVTWALGAVTLGAGILIGWAIWG